PVLGRVHLNRADQRRHRPDLARDLLERFGDVAAEASLEQQVARWVTADDEFREYHEFRAGGDEVVVGGEDLLPVARQVTDGGIELGEAEAHAERGKR